MFSSCLISRRKTSTTNNSKPKKVITSAFGASKSTKALTVPMEFNFSTSRPRVRHQTPSNVSSVAQSTTRRVEPKTTKPTLTRPIPFKFQAPARRNAPEATTGKRSFVSLAEQLKGYETWGNRELGATEVDARKGGRVEAGGKFGASNAAVARLRHHIPTRPISPKLRTKRRFKPTSYVFHFFLLIFPRRSITTEEKELQEIRKFVFKAQPINLKVRQFSLNLIITSHRFGHCKTLTPCRFSIASVIWGCRG